MFSRCVRPISLLQSKHVSVVVSKCLASSSSSDSKERVYKSTQERPLLSEYKLKGRTVRVEKGVEEDMDLICDFMSDICAVQEPTSISTGTTSADFRPFVERIATKSVKDGYTMMVMDGERLIGAGIGNRVEVDMSEAVEPRILEDYGELVDHLNYFIPSRKMRQVVAPAYHLAKMAPHFLPKGVEEFMRYDLVCVQKPFIGGNLIKKMIYELTRSSLRNGIVYGDTQTTAKASHRAHLSTGSRDVFHIPYDRILDHGKRIHPKVPLADGSTGINLFIIDLKDLEGKVKC